MSLKKTQSEALTYNKMRPVNAKALPIIAFALTGRIVLLGFILCVGRESDVPLINLIGGYLISCSPHKTVSLERTGRTGYGELS